MEVVSAKELSKALHALGHSNHTAELGILHDESSKPPHRHTVWKNDKGQYDGEIIFDGINFPTHYLAEEHLSLLS
tara:strand:+ start:90 stop:314 length:225 start_codon:yes stop_codon:yes gene_type:complete